MPKHQWGGLSAPGAFGSGAWKATWGSLLQPEFPSLPSLSGELVEHPDGLGHVFVGSLISGMRPSPGSV